MLRRGVVRIALRDEITRRDVCDARSFESGEDGIILNSALFKA